LVEVGSLLAELLTRGQQPRELSEWNDRVHRDAQVQRDRQGSTLGEVIGGELPFRACLHDAARNGYMNLALPSNLARIAVNIRFFQRQGLSAATSVAAGTHDSCACTIMQPILLGVLLIFSESSLAFDLPFRSGGMRTCSGSSSVW
jgi:hypothetical protein